MQKQALGMRRGAICASASACKASFERKKRGIYCKQPLKKYNLKTQKVLENALSHEKCRTIIRKLANQLLKKQGECVILYKTR